METFLIPTNFSIKNQEHIYLLQQALVALKFNIDPSEIKERRYDKSTMEAVRSFQEQHCLPFNSNVPSETINAINAELERLYRVCGYLTNDYGMPVEGIIVKINKNLFNGAIYEIGTAITLKDGSYRSYIDISKEALGIDGLLKDKLCIEISFLQKDKPIVTSGQLLIGDLESIFNFISDKVLYTGDSVYSSVLKTLESNGIKKDELILMKANDFVRMNSFTGIDREVLMKLLFSEMLFSSSKIEAEAYFGYIYQGIPLNMAIQLFDDSMVDLKDEEWEQYKKKTTEQIHLGLVLLSQEQLQNSLSDACKQYIINQHPEDWVRAVVDYFSKQKKDSAYYSPILEGNESLGSIIDSMKIVLTSEGKQQLTTLFIDNLTNFNLFIELLKKEKYYSLPLELCFQISRIVRNFPPAIIGVYSRYGKELEQYGVRYLASLTLKNWMELLTEYPKDMGNEEYYQLVYNSAKELNPDIASVSQIEVSGKFKYTREIKETLFQNGRLDMLVNRMDDFSINPAYKDNPDFVAEFKTVQRVYRISPSANAASILLENGIKSSGQVYFTGKRQLEENFKDTLSQAEIDSVFDMASARFSNALSAYANINEIFNAVNPQLVSRYDKAQIIKDLQAEFPDIETLFGNTDYCECEHDSSVYGAAAYLADVLAFLDERRSNVAGKTVRDFLNERRSDISNIYLNAQNTNTVLPYIDLVCEALEEATIKTSDTSFVRNIATCQSTLSTKELCAAPQHMLTSSTTKSTAYDIIKKSVYPMYAPLNLYQTESRAYLDKIGIARYNLMQTFQTNGNTSENVNIAAEYFGLTGYEQGIVTATTPILGERNKTWFPNPGAGTSVAAMNTVSFMRDSGLSTYNVMDLLKATWVKISCENFTTDCSYKNKNISSTPAGFDRAHRFIRLWRKSGWKVGELNLLLFSTRVTGFINLNTDNLNASALHNLRLFSQQQKALNVSCEELLAFYGDINTADVYENGKECPSLYRTLFLNNSLANPANANLSAIRTSPTATLAADGSDDALVAACLTISKTDFDLLKSKYTAAKNRAFLSYLYRHATLAKKLKILLPELITLLEMLKVNIANPYAMPEADANNLTKVITQSQRVADSPFSLAEYEYVLNYGYGVGTLSEAAKRISLTADQLEKYTNELYALLKDVTLPVDVGEKTAAIELAIKNYISKNFELSTSSTKLYLEYPTGAGSESLLQKLSDPASYSPTQNIYYILIQIHKAALTIKKIDGNDTDFDLLLKLQDKVGINWFSFKTGTTLTALTLAKLLDVCAMETYQKGYGIINEKTLYNLLVDFKSTPDTSVPADAFSSALCQFTGWDFAAFKIVIGGTGLNFRQGNFYTPATYTRIGNCMKMIAAVGVPAATILAWRIRETTDAREITQASEIKNAAKALYDIDTWLNELPSIQKNIREAKADALASYLIANSIRGTKLWNTKTDLYNYFLLDTEMSSCMKTSRIVQATCSVQLFVQRCFLNLENNITVNEEICPEWKQWNWMKKYRLWEANRKIFLYPENWIEPELRDDKTPFFKELEEELSQGDVTNEQAENVFENYLQKLHAVSNLMICGTFREVVDSNDGIKTDNNWEVNTSKVDTLHVIARTKSSPFEYYYRNYDAYNSIWSHWEKIELDIKGDVVIPMVYNRKLHLFWLFPKEKVCNNNETKSEKPKSPDNYTEIQLGWSVLKNKKWTSAKYSHKKHIQYGHRPAIDYSLIATYLEDVNEVRLDVRYLYDHTTWNFDKHPAYYSVLSGSFYFDGDVSKSVSNICLFDGALGDNFNKLTKDISYDAKPILDESNKEEESLGPNDAVFYASRLYPVEKSPSGQWNIYLHSYMAQFSGTGRWSAKFMSTYNQDPNIIQVFHNQPYLWYALFESHLYNPLFYQDSRRSFFIKPFDVRNRAAKYKLYPFYHAYTNLFIKELNRCGIEGLMNRNIQLSPYLYKPYNSFDFNAEYSPEKNVVLAEDYRTTKNVDILDFDVSGAYSIYNWELFFHTPLYIACKLSQNQKYEEAMQWFHYIFNPTDKSKEASPQKFWITKPFFTLSTPENRSQQIREILTNIKKHAVEVNAWLNNPFNPHLVVRTRPVAYQKTVVMKYIDNLIAWADQLFRQDSMESNNEATLLYILAYEILGKRPVMLPENGLATVPSKNYNDIKVSSNQYLFLDAYDAVFNYMFSANETLQSIAAPDISKPACYQQKSNYKPAMTVNTKSRAAGTAVQRKLPVQPASYQRAVETTAQYRTIFVPTQQAAKPEPLPRIDAENFCVPYNDKLLGYWDLVEDRLFKLRHCMNIEGIVRELPLFEPPIDPAMLVKAVAAGLSIADALNDITALQPYYRFRVILQKAVEFTNEVKQFGEKLLSALEKKDAETLSLLRSSQEITMHKAIKQIRTLQIEEAKQNIEAVNESIKNAERRKEYYASKEFMNKTETAAYKMSVASAVMDTIVASGNFTAALLSAIPDFGTGGAGAMGTPFVGVTIGGKNFSGGLNLAMQALATTARVLDKNASHMSTQAGYQRRKEDWDFQAEMADMELQQLNKQLTASEIRLMMAEKELENQEMQIEQSQSVKEYYQNKYTNEALYNWMITQVSSLYFQSYKLAYDMAKKAEMCYQHELGIYDTTNFIRFGYWDSLKKGLLSGDKLIHDLHRLDAEYINKNKRTLELTKHISLSQMFPGKLIELVTSADKSTDLDLQEFIFDMDYPGHYMRRIKSVSITIPNVAGPYTNVSFMLSLQSAKVRKKSTGNNYDEEPVGNDLRFNYQTGGSQSICTSSAQNDSGMFELNFGDERYLPFEGAGVISKWRLSLPAGCSQFDVSSISDVILHIHYTAVYDGVLEGKARTALQSKLPSMGALLFSLKQDFPDAWNQMTGSATPMNFTINTEQLPFFLRSKASLLNVAAGSALLVSKNSLLSGKVFKLTSSGVTLTITLAANPQLSGDVYLYNGTVSPQTGPLVKGAWTAAFGGTGGLAVSDIVDVWIGFKLSE